MISEGLIEEARQYYGHRKLNALNTVGYKELFDYFDNKIDKAEAIELIKRNRNYRETNLKRTFKRKT